MKIVKRYCHHPSTTLLILIGFVVLAGFHSLLAQNPSQTTSQDAAGAEAAALEAGRAAFAKGDFDKAREQFALGFASGKSFDAGVGLAQSLLKLDRWQEAQEMAFKAMRLRSTAPEAMAVYGDALFRGGNLNDAGLNYLRALGANESFAPARVGLAIMKISRGEYDEAVSHLQEAIAARPELARAYYWLGVVFELQGKYPAAAGAYEKFLSFKETGYPESALSENLPNKL